MQTSNPGALIRNSKLRGEWAELRFMTRAAEHGLMVSRPWGDSAPYDVMVEHSGRILRVQIKSTMRIVRGAYRCHVPKCGADTPVGLTPEEQTSAVTTEFQTKASPTRSRKPSPPRHAQIDFLAAYLIPLDLWYILPAPIATRLHGHISLSPHHQGHKYQPYQEAWHLLLG